MSNFFELTDESELDQRRRAAQGYVAPTTFDGYMGALGAGLDATGIKYASDALHLGLSELTDTGNESLTAKEANDFFEPTVPFEEDTTWMKAAIRKENERRQIEQAEAINGSDIGWKGTALTMVTGMADPMLWAASLAAGAGTAFAGARLAKLTYGARVLAMASKSARGRKAIDFGLEVMENVGVAAMYEIPVQLGKDELSGIETSSNQHLANIAMGTAGGFAFRQIGHKLRTKSSAILNTLDAESLHHVMANELAESLKANRPPNYDDAAEKYLVKVNAYMNDPAVIREAYSVVGEFSLDTKKFYATAKSDYSTLTDSHVGVGRTFGSGLHMVNNPAMAMGKALHLDDAEIIKFDTSKFNILDIETPIGKGSKLISVVVDELNVKGVSKSKIASLVKDADTMTFKEVLDAVEKLTVSSGDDAVDAINAKLKSVFGIEGYTFKENLGTSRSLTTKPTDGIQENLGIFLFKGTDLAKTGDAPRINVDMEPSRAGWEDAVRAEEARARATAHGEEIIKDSPLMIERNGRASKGYNREYELDNDGSILYKNEDFVEEYYSAFVRSQTPMLEQPKKTTANIVKEYRDSIDEFLDNMNEKKPEADGDSFGKSAGEVTDEVYADRMEAFLKERGTSMDEVKATIDSIDKVEETVKAGITCVRRK